MDPTTDRPDYCTRDMTAEPWLAQNARALWCGAAAAWSVPFGFLGGAVEDVTGSWSGAVEDVTGFGSGAVEDVTGFGSGAVEDVTEAANPLNLLGLGLGLSLGGVVAASGLALVGAFAADQILFGGSGTMALVGRVRR